MFKYIMFDLDGTLSDSAEGITKSVQFALLQKGINEPDLNKLHKFIGPPLTYAFMEFYGFSQEEAQELILVFRKRYEPIGAFENKLYPGIIEVLAALKDKGCHLVVASSKPEAQVYRILDYFKIREFFDVIAGSPLDEKNYAKEDVLAAALLELMGIIDGKAPDIEKPNEIFTPVAEREDIDLDEEMDKHDINKTTCAMVGDRNFDIKAAKEYGVTAIGVDYGYAKEGELEAAGADMIASDTKELLKVLLGESSGRVKKN